MKQHFPVTRTLLTTLLFAFTTSQAEACTLAEPRIGKPLKVRADCSFENAGRLDFGSGDAPVRLGNDLTVQTVTYEQYGSIFSIWLVADCNQKRFLSIRPKIDHSAMRVCGPNYDLSAFKDANGYLRTSAATGFDALRAEAGKAGHELNETDWINRLDKNGFNGHSNNPFSQKIDPFCSCPLHYPESDD